jgi:Mg-chelatase subunit ChlD
MKLMKQWKRSLALGILAISLAGPGSPPTVASQLDQAPDPGGVTYSLADTWADVPWEPEAGRFGRVRDISSAPDGTIYMLDVSHGFVHVLAPDGSPRRYFQVPDTNQTDGTNTWLACQMDVGFDGLVYVMSKEIDHADYCSYGAARVDRLSPDGRLLDRLEIAPSDFHMYADLALRSDGRIYLSRFGTAGEPLTLDAPRAVDVYSPAGELLVSLTPPELGLPGALDIGADGTAYIVNRVPDAGSPFPPGTQPTPRPSVSNPVLYSPSPSRIGGGGWGEGAGPRDHHGLTADAPHQIPAPIEGVLILEPDHRYRETVPFVNARDVAVGPAGVFVSRDSEIYPLREREPVFAGPPGYFGTGMRLDVPVDGRVLAGMNHCYFQGLIEIADPSARPDPGRLVGRLDRPDLEGPVYPLRLAASHEVAVLQGAFDTWGERPDLEYSTGLEAEQPQTVQRWTRRGVPVGAGAAAPPAAPPADRGRGRLAAQLGVCGRWDGRPTRDVAIDDRDVYTVDATAIQSRPDDLFPAWTLVPDIVAEPDSSAYLGAVAADGGQVAALDSGSNRVIVADRSGTGAATWAIDAPDANSLPVDIAIAAAAADRVYLADQGASRVLVRTLDGGDLGAWPTHDGPMRLAVGPSGDVFVLGRGGWGLRYRPDGRLVAAWPMPSRAVDALDIAVDADGRVYVNFLERSGQDAPFGWSISGGFDILSSGVWVFEPAAVPPSPAPPAEACIARPDKDAAPVRIPLGAEVEVSLTVEGTCPGVSDPVQLAVVFDTSRSMNMDDALARARTATLALLGELDPRTAEVALVTFNNGGTLDLPLSRDIAGLRARVAALAADGDSRLAAGIDTATAELTGPRGDRAKRRVIVIVSDGAFKDDPQSAAARARAAGIDLYALVFRNIEFDRLSLDPLLELETMTGSTARVLLEPAPGVLMRLARDMVRFQPEEGLFKTITIEDVIPPNMRYVADSAIPAARYDPARHSLTWTLADILATDGLRLHYHLVPLQVGIWPTNVRAEADYRDMTGAPGKLIFPIPEVEVTGTAHRAYLPFAAARSCLRRARPLDVALVIDSSSSMAEAAPGGGSKLDAARSAAGTFVGLLDLPSDRVAIVAFNQAATRVAALTGDRGRLLDALAGLATAPGTRIDLGLTEAGAVLAAADRPGAQQAVILLTDGLQNTAEAPNTAVVSAADRLKAAGVLVYTIGLGDAIDRELLRALASSADRSYESPSAADLAAIYAAISVQMACEGGGG